MTDTPNTTARTFAGYYRELRASGVPRGLAESMVATAAAKDWVLDVHPDALAAVDTTRDKALGKTEPAPMGLGAGMVFYPTDPAPATPGIRKGPKPKGMGPSARERRGPLLDAPLQAARTRTVHYIGPFLDGSYLWSRP
ncbi:hypothetical protein Q8791_23570 [Nocardiopsis sp. CT-R113]|uniref:Uncharacterized protein n=1 Tax=Nocardiopsis codii TaxID=3065942 RepID=A0ABU7KD94_9ACTN|nr:hypothetical protein [Nocardiopsis sp. CT-R113]MEE2040201.1 hypothetical protein [Nocardiopsis sp. CT-R113]